MIFLSILFVVSINGYLLLDQALPVTRNNLIFFSYFLPLFLQFRRPDSRIWFFLFLPITTMMFGSYSAQLHLISPETFGKQFIRNIYYIILISLSLSYRFLPLERFKSLAFFSVIGFFSLFFVLDISGGAALAGFLVVWVFSERGMNFRLLLLFLLTLFVYFYFSLVWNGGSWDRLENFLYLASFGLAFLFVSSQKKTKFKDLQKGISLLVGAQVLWLVFHYTVSGSQNQSGEILLSGVHLSQVGALSLLGFLFLPRIRKPQDWFLVGILFFLFLTAVYISKSRISQIAFVLLLIMRIFHGFRNLSQHPFRKFTFLLLCLSTGIVFLFLYSNPKSLDLQSLAVRYSIWFFHIQQTWLHSPWFGFGPLPENVLYFQQNATLDPVFLQRIRDYLDTFHSYPQAHNVFVEWFSSYGLVGLLLLILGLSIALKKLKSKWFFLGFFVLLFHGSFDLNLLEPPIFYFLALALGLSLRVRTPNLKPRLVILAKGLLLLVFSGFLLSFAKTFALEDLRFYLSDQFAFDNLSVAKFRKDAPVQHREFNCQKFEPWQVVLQSEKLTQYQFLCECKQSQWKSDKADWNKTLAYLFFRFPKNPENLNLIIEWWGSENPGLLLDETKHLIYFLDPLQIL